MTTRSATTWTRLIVGFVVVYGVLAIGTALDSSVRSGLLTLAAVLVAVALTEWVQARSARAVVCARLGLGAPGVPALLAATAVSLLPVALRPNWPWLLLGVFAVHGLAEELVWRGFVFRRLRETHAFWPAVWWSMPFVVAAHVPIVLTVGPVVGLGAMLVAAVTSVPLSYLYEWGRRTLWAPALVHTAIDSFKIVEVPAGTTTFSLALIAVSLTAPLLVFALPRRLRPPVDAASTSSVRLPAGPPGRTDSGPARLLPPATIPPTGEPRQHDDARPTATGRGVPEGPRST